MLSPLQKMREGQTSAADSPARITCPGLPCAPIVSWTMFSGVPPRPCVFQLQSLRVHMHSKGPGVAQWALQGLDLFKAHSHAHASSLKVALNPQSSGLF